MTCGCPQGAPPEGGSLSSELSALELPFPSPVMAFLLSDPTILVQATVLEETVVALTLLPPLLPCSPLLRTALLSPSHNLGAFVTFSSDLQSPMAIPSRSLRRQSSPRDPNASSYQLQAPSAKSGHSGSPLPAWLPSSAQRPKWHQRRFLLNSFPSSSAN